jgi:hypothetical protein
MDTTAMETLGPPQVERLPNQPPQDTVTPGYTGWKQQIENQDKPTDQPNNQVSPDQVQVSWNTTSPLKDSPQEHTKDDQQLQVIALEMSEDEDMMSQDGDLKPAAKPTPSQATTKPGSPLATPPGSPNSKDKGSIETSGNQMETETSDEPKPNVYPFPPDEIVTVKFNQAMPKTDTLIHMSPFSTAELAKDIKQHQLHLVLHNWQRSEFVIKDLEGKEPKEWEDEMITILINITFTKTVPDANYYYPGKDDKETHVLKKKARQFFLTLAVTDRTQCPNWDVTKKALIQPLFIERLLWHAQTLFGPAYKLYLADKERRKQAAAPTETPPPLKFARKDPPPAVDTATETKATTTIPIVQAPQNTSDGKPPRDPPKFKTFFSASTPGHEPIPDGNEGWSVRHSISKNLIETLLHQLYKHDPKARLLKYPAELNSKPSKNWLHHLSPVTFKPKTKTGCNSYLYLQPLATKHWREVNGKGLHCSRHYSGGNA